MRALLPLVLATLTGCAMEIPVEVGSSSAALAPTPEERIPVLGVQNGGALASGPLTAFPLNQTALARVSFVYYDGNTVAADGSANLDHFDAVVRRYAENGVTILPGLIKVAPYTIDGRTEVGAMYVLAEELPRWRRFGYTLALRYGAGGTFWSENPEVPPHPIRAWEIWNEPNLETFWDSSPRNTRPSPRRYRRILREAHLGLRTGDPRARVIFAGLALPHDAPNVGWRPFLREVLDGDTPAARERNRCLFDAVAIHPYAESVSGSIHHVERLHRYLEREGLTGRDRDRDVQIWITEVGWSVPVEGHWPACRRQRPDGSCRRWSSQLTVEDETQQAARVHAEMKQLDRRRARWRLGPTFWYSIDDLYFPDCEGSHAKWWCFSGLWTTDEGGRRPRPAWQALGDEAAGRTVSLPPVRCAAPDPTTAAADDASDAATDGGDGV